MLRNQQNNKQLLKYLLPSATQHRLIQQNKVLCNKSTKNVSRQGKILAKLFGQRMSGSKKHWFPSTTDEMKSANSNVFFKQSQFGKLSKRGGKNDTRRMTVLNKLFMKHITDLMATGEISESILGKGLQISKVKISQDFAYINVFWVSSGEVSKDLSMEHELHRCSGLLRHELSQLGLMGVVPRIKFVKDKIFTNMNQVEVLLRNMNFDTDEEEQQQEFIDIQSKYEAETLKQEFCGRETNNTASIEQKDLKENDKSPRFLDFNVPEMRHDVLGLDHKGIMLKIHTKMRKSKQAWDQHLHNTSTELNYLNSLQNSSTIPSTSFSQLAKINEKLARASANSESFDAFLAKRKERRNTPERKKFRVSDHNTGEINEKYNQHDYTPLVMSTRQRQIFEAEDYLPEEMEDTRHK